jgi:NADPH:quinone reductase-like Zn-dependent oxidoreductase
MGRIELFDYLRPLNRLRPLLTGQGRAHHGEILREAIRLAELGLLRTQLDPRRFALAEAEQACQLIENAAATGKVVVDVAG